MQLENYCQATFNADCKFKENIFENYWNIYARLASIEDAGQNVRYDWPIRERVLSINLKLHIAVK